MVGFKSDNSNILQAKCPTKSNFEVTNINFSEESAEGSFLPQLFCKKLIILLYLLTAGLLMAILFFTIHTTLTIQNMDMFVRLHYKIIKTTPIMETTSKTTREYGFTTEALQVLDDTSTTAIVKRDTSEIVPREQWNAEFPTSITKLVVPVDIIIISHTATQNCNTSTACEKLIKSMQRFHMKDRQWWDIGYNFIVGGDGKVYEGRGWTCVGSHTFGYNTKSLGIALTGNFETKIPNEAQIEVCKELIKMGVQWGYVDKNYKLFGASQLVATASPGKALLENMKTWPHFTEKV